MDNYLDIREKYNKIFSLQYSYNYIEHLILEDACEYFEHWKSVSTVIESKVENIFKSLKEKKLDNTFCLFVKEVLLKEFDDLDFELTKLDVIYEARFYLEFDHLTNELFVNYVIQVLKDESPKLDYEKAFYIIENCLETLPEQERYFKVVEAILGLTPKRGGDREDQWNFKALAFGWLSNMTGEKSYKILLKLLESDDERTAENAERLIKLQYDG